MTISLRLNDEDTNIIKPYAKLKGISVSELVRRSIFEQIEDEYDLKIYNEAIKEYQNKPVTYSHKEVANMIELD